MKKIFVIIAVVAVAVMSAVSCKKAEDPAITSVKAGCVGDWTGEIESKTVTVTFSPSFKITTTGNFEAQITNWSVKSGSVWVELDNSPAKVMAIQINGVNMKVTTESADLKAVIPSSMTKLLQ